MAIIYDTQTGRLIPSAHTPDYASDQRYLVNPTPEEIAANPPPAPAPLPYDEARRRDYLAAGITAEAMAVALWERDIEGRPEVADALQVKRESIKAKYPKPKPA